MIEPIFTPEQLAEVKAYVWPHYIWEATSDFVVVGMNLLLLRFGVTRLWRLAAFLEGKLAPVGARVRGVPVLRAVPAAMDKVWNGPGWGQALWFALFCMVSTELALMPFFLYFNYFHEHAFGLSNYSPLGFLWDVIKSDAVTATAISMLTVGMWGLARRLRGWWLILGTVAGLGSFGAEALDAYRSTLLFEQSPLPPGLLRSQLEDLLHRGHIEFGDILVQKSSRATKKVDVWCAGRGPALKVILTDGFVEKFPPDEVVAAVAHEAGHIHESRLLGRLGSFLATLGFLFLVDRILRWAPRRGWYGIRDFADIRTLPIIFFIFFLLTDAVVPFSAAYSRQNERDADRFAVKMTGNPAAFESMLVRAARINKADPDPPRWAVLLGWSHPPYSERIAWAEEQKAQLGRAPHP